MAIIPINNYLTASDGQGHQASLSYSYDNTFAPLRLTRFDFANNTGRPVLYSFTGTTSPFRNYSGTIPAATTVFGIALNNNNAANRIGLSLTPSGKLDGLEVNVFQLG